jgi:hypothetical protein
MVPWPWMVVTLFVFIGVRNPAVKRLHNPLLALLYLRQIDMRAVDHNAVLGCLFFDEHEMTTRSEQRFAVNAAHVQASATKFLVLLDNGGLQSELACADRGNVATRTGASNNNIKFFHMSLTREQSPKKSHTQLLPYH